MFKHRAGVPVSWAKRQVTRRKDKNPALLRLYVPRQEETMKLHGYTGPTAAADKLR